MAKAKLVISVIALIIFALVAKNALKINNKYQKLKKFYSQSSFIVKCVITNKATMQNLYQIVKDVTEVMEKHDIPYWAEGGTLIGALRHGGAIPWDDDADLQMMEENIEKFKALAVADLIALGYRVNLDPRFFQIFHQKTIGLEFAGGHLDVFPMHREGDSLFYAHPATRSEYKCDHSYKAIFPLKKHKFGSIEINIAQDPYVYLSKCYGGSSGEAWKNEAVIYNHGIMSSPVRTKLTDELRKPGEHPWPLQDRVQK